jgi:CRISPR-associated protein Cas2
VTAQCHAELIALLDGIIHHDHDHMILVDIGIAEQLAPRIRRSFSRALQCSLRCR